MAKDEYKKKLSKISLFYGIIIAAVNYIGYLMPSMKKVPVEISNSYIVWLEFMNSHTNLITGLYFLTFIIPTGICFCYTIICKPEKYKTRIINMPLMFSIIGGTGWLFAFILETICLVIVKSKTGILIGSLILTSFLNIVQECMFICTLGFLILNTIHRKLVLPKWFPDGKLMQYNGVIKLSSRALFTFFYISVGVFPFFYLTSTLYNLSLVYNFEIEKSLFIVLGVIIVFGIVIVITFANQYSEPLKKLRNATKKISESKYDEKVNVVSNDDFGELADNFNDMATELGQKTRKILEIQDSVIRGMAVMVESRDNSTGGHINRTSDCVKVFVAKLKESAEFSSLSESFCNAVIKAAPMHDLGKIAVDDMILRKPGKFTDAEYEAMKKHSAEGAKIVEKVLKDVDDLEFKQIAINVAHYHHEKWDGAGYPEKISGEDIPLEARIMALADVFDALVSKRCYKDSFSYDKAFNIIEGSLGTHFDPELGRIFINSRSELIDLYDSY